MLLIKNGFIMTMSQTEYGNGFVLIDSGKILEIGRMEDFEESKLSEYNIIDAAGLYVLPGFIDPHCHIGLKEDGNGSEGDDMNEATDPVTPHLRAIDGINPFDRSFAEARENGITTVITGPGSTNVIGGQFAALKTFGDRIEDMIIKEPVAISVTFGESPKFAYGAKNQTPMTRMAIAGLVREYLSKAKEYKQRRYAYEESFPQNEKPGFDIKLEALIKVIDNEIPLKAQVHRADDIYTAIRIAKEFGITITLEYCTEGHLIKDILLSEGLPVIWGPALAGRSRVELRNYSIKAPGMLSRAGIQVSIMSDHPDTPVHLLNVYAAIAAREGMPENDALKAITINAAKATSIADRVGSIEKGKDADLAVFKGYPLNFDSTVVYTIINGNIVYANQQ